MIKEAIGFGPTVDEAKEDAMAKLGATELDDVQFEVIAINKKKIFGLFGGSDAQVRAYMEVPEKKNKAGKKTPAKTKAVKENQDKEKPAKKAEIKKEAAAKPAAKETKPALKETKPAEKPDEGYGEAVDASEISGDTPAGKAVAYIKAVLKSVDCENTDIKVASREDASLILLNGDNLSIVIGHRGETLDALQYLASLAANNGGGHYKISINIGDYRERREKTLTDLAKRISAQVLKNGKSRTLEPMNPYERRIIHTAVQEIDGVVSNSFGDGAGRRVVISPEGAEVRPPRNNDRRRRHGRGGSRPPKNNVVVTETREPKRDSDMPLYGKIN